MLPFTFRSVLGLCLISGLIACGGGGGGNAGIDGSGSPAIAVVSGPINGFGSVIINGVHYNTDNTEFWVRGSLANESTLNVGSYIHLEGTVDSSGKEGVANRIYFQPNIIGAVSSVNVLAETFVVLGQTVHLANDTAFDFNIAPRDINGIRVGQQVEVSGPQNAEGDTIATRVGLIQTTAKELAGKVTNLNLDTKTFRINTITVNFAKTSFVPALSNGQRVILRGANTLNGVIQPSTIELEMKPNLPQGQLVTQTGLITRFVSAQDFTLGNFDITTDSATQYIHTEASKLGLNVKATIAGHLQDGKLLADTITWLADAEWKIQGPISDVRNLSLTGGEVLVQGTWLKLTPNARLDSNSSVAGDRMKFNNLQPNDFVIITGHQEGVRKVVNSLEREAVPQLDIEKKVLGFIQPLPLASDATAFWLEPKVLVLMDENTHYYENGGEITKGMFTQKAARQFVTVFGVMVDDGSYNTFKASSILITPGPTPIPGPAAPKPGDFSKPRDEVKPSNPFNNGAKPDDSAYDFNDPGVKPEIKPTTTPVSVPSKENPKPSKTNTPAPVPAAPPPAASA